MDEVTRRVQRGDPDALAGLVNEHYGPVYRFCARRVGPELAQDATQETFLTMQKTIKRFRGEASLRTWLLGIAHNVCRNQMRAKAKEPLALEHWLDTPGPDLAATVVDQMSLSAGLLRLSPEHREVVVMHEIEELTYAEIAAILGIPEGTVKSRLSNAFARLRTVMCGVNA